MSRKIIFIGLLILFLVIKFLSTESKDSRNVICLVDYSGTITSEERIRYTTVIEQNIIRNLRKGDKLKIMPIDEGAVRKREVIFEFDPGKLDLKRAGDGWSGAAAKRKERLQDTLDHFIRELERAVLKNERSEKYGRSTNILGAIRQLKLDEVAKAKEKTAWGGWFPASEGQQNVAILFSDMIHDADGVHFSDSGINFVALLRKLEEEHQIPELDQWVFFVFGIQGNGLSNDHFEKMQLFWYNWFEKSDGVLEAMDFDCKGKIEEFFTHQ